MEIIFDKIVNTPLIMIFGFIMLGVMFLGVFLWFLMYTHVRYHTMNFVRSLDTATPSVIKSETFRIQKLQIGKNFDIMKKAFTWAIILFTIGMIGLAGFLVYDSRDYFQDYFEIKQKKLLLQTEQATDSLINVIDVRESMIDSLKMKELRYNDTINMKQQELNQILESNRSLKRAVTHQGTMIKRLGKDVDYYKKKCEENND